MSRACPACGSAPGPSLRRARDKTTFGGGPLTLVACRCGAQFQPRVPTAEELARWYEYMGHNPANSSISPLLWRRLARLVTLLEPARQNGRLVEIGCGGGLFVRAAAEAGWQAWGSEISSSCAALLRPLMGERLHLGTIEDAPFAPRSFDAAVMIEVIEHLDEPGRYLEAIARLVRPGGRLLLTTPNARGSAARVLGLAWRGFTDEHLNYFDRSSLRTLLERHGFTDVHVSTTNLDLLTLAAQLRHRLRRPRGNGSAAPTTTTTAAPPASDDGTVSLRVHAADLAIEAVNRVADATRLGDTLKATATRR